MSDDRPVINAKFNLDASGRPAYDLDGAGTKHYHITLFVHGLPRSAQSVTYRLDKSYYDPIRESFDAEHEFKTEITSFGDYELTVSPSGVPSMSRMVPSSLVEALERGMSDSKQDPAVKNALNEIRSL